MLHDVEPALKHLRRGGAWGAVALARSVDGCEWESEGEDDAGFDESV